MFDIFFLLLMHSILTFVFTAQDADRVHTHTSQCLMKRPVLHNVYLFTKSCAVRKVIARHSSLLRLYVTYKLYTCYSYGSLGSTLFVNVETDF
jgi:hypothetical protein